MKKIIAIVLVLALLVLSGCAASPKKQGDENLIAVSFYPVYIFTMNLVKGIDDIRVSSIAEQNVGCLHDYTITTKDAKLINDADVFIINGAGMEGFVEDLYETVDNLKVIDSSVGVDLLCGEGHHHKGEEVHEDEHHHEDEHVHEHGHHHHHEFNSHIWMSVKNAKIQVKNIKNGLIEIYPQYKKLIEENYKEYLGRLNSLQEELNIAKEKMPKENIMTFHNAYAYLAEDMDLKIVDCIESGPHGGEPSAKKLVELSKEIKEKNVKALFVEPNYTGSAARILSQETGAAVYVLNPVTHGEKTLTAYEDTMRKNIEIIVEAVK